MKKSFVILISLLATVTALAGEVVLGGTRLKPLVAEVPASSGLNALYVVDGLTGLTVSYRPDDASASVSWQRYSNLGGGYAETVGCHREPDGTWRLDTPEGDMGYIITEGSRAFYFWITDYSRHALSLEALSPTSGSDCSMDELALAGQAGPITYYSVNGRSMELSRELEISYNTLEYDEESAAYRQTETNRTLTSAGAMLHVPAPLCSTAFTLSGDRFLRQWGEEQSVTTAIVEPHAVEAHTSAVRQGDSPDNEVKDGDAEALGGSAPAVVVFKAVVSDAAIFTEWQLSGTSDFEDILLRESQTEFTHTFDELGTTYVRFICDNAQGTCQWTGPVYEVTIGESSLRCPNAFSPGASEGVNDEWRVSYKSIVSFECHIFNRYGQKMATLTDPSQGWDGRHGGKLVPAGVYYYVIKARGADGKKYDLGGDINIVNYK